MIPTRPLLQVTNLPDGRRSVDWFFSRGQRQAMESKKRIVAIFAGWQSGKSEIGPPWLLNEMLAKGPGDYLIASPTFPLMSKKVLPIFQRLFERMMNLGKFVGGKNIFTFSDEGCMRLWGHIPNDPARVLFGHAGDPDSLESATVKAAWLDECGQKGFRLASFDAIMGRLSIHQGRVLLTSRPYDLAWMKQLIWDPWVKAKQHHPDIDIINFRSIDNPAFPPKEYWDAKARMPAWQFAMKYDGLFSRPAGLIYSCFDRARHVVPRFSIPPSWRRFLGLDFGGVNTAGIFLAEEKNQESGKPTGRYFAYREYKAGDRTAAEHCYELTKGEPMIPTCAGGSRSEGQWRREFSAGGTVNGERVVGLPIHGPAVPTNEAAVMVGINRVFAMMALDRIMFFEDLAGMLDDVESYSFELDEMGEPIEKIDCPNDFHFADALRYIVNFLNPDKQQTTLTGSPIAVKGLTGL
jgi:hypothetical protein